MEFALQNEISSAEIKSIRQKLGLTQKELASFMGVSVKTVEHWERGKQVLKGAAAVLLCILEENSQVIEQHLIPVQQYPLRLKYRYKHKLCTVIDVDERNRKIKIKNFVEDPIFCAFGRNRTPSFEDYEKFIESRCFPRTRDKMKVMLRELNLPFYDPFMIIEKTQGRMAEDDFWIEIERNAAYGQII